MADLQATSLARVAYTVLILICFLPAGKPGSLDCAEGILCAEPACNKKTGGRLLRHVIYVLIEYMSGIYKTTQYKERLKEDRIFS